MRTKSLLFTLSVLILSKAHADQILIKGVVNGYKTNLLRSPNITDYDVFGSELSKNDTVFIVSYTKQKDIGLSYEFYEIFYDNRSYFIKSVDLTLTSEISKKELKEKRSELLDAVKKHFIELDKYYFDEDTVFITFKVEKYSSINLLDTNETNFKIATPREGEEIYIFSYKSNRLGTKQYYAIYNNQTVLFGAIDYYTGSIRGKLDYLESRRSDGFNQRYENCLKKSIARKRELNEIENEKETTRLNNEKLKEERLSRLDTALKVGVTNYNAKLLLDDGTSEELPEGSIVFVYGYKTADYRSFYEAFFMFKNGAISIYDLEIKDSLKEYLMERKQVNIDTRRSVAQLADSVYTMGLIINHHEKMEKYKKMQFVLKGVDTFKSEYSSSIDVDVEFFNASNKTIKYVWFSFMPYNRVGDVVGGSSGGLKQVKGIGPIESNTDASLGFENLYFSSVVSCVTITGIKVQYMDGSFKSFQPNLCLDEGTKNSCILY